MNRRVATWLAEPPSQLRGDRKAGWSRARCGPALTCNATVLGMDQEHRRTGSPGDVLAATNLSVRPVESAASLVLMNVLSTLAGCIYNLISEESRYLCASMQLCWYVGRSTEPQTSQVLRYGRAG